MDESQQNPFKKIKLNFSMVSLVFSFAALLSCCAPPMQFFCGASAVMSAVLSRKDHFSGMARVGLVFGILSIICSIAVFIQYVVAMRLMSDPANAALVKEATRYYEEIMRSFQVN